MVALRIDGPLRPYSVRFFVVVVRLITPLFPVPRWSERRGCCGTILESFSIVVRTVLYRYNVGVVISRADGVYRATKQT
jgi:hypothetical protein